MFLKAHKEKKKKQAPWLYLLLFMCSVYVCVWFFCFCFLGCVCVRRLQGSTGSHYIEQAGLNPLPLSGTPYHTQGSSALLFKTASLAKPGAH